jgi:hypothetical protein
MSNNANNFSDFLNECGYYSNNIPFSSRKYIKYLRDNNDSLETSCKKLSQLISSNRIHRRTATSNVFSYRTERPYRYEGLSNKHNYKNNKNYNYILFYGIFFLIIIIISKIKYISK